MYLCLNMTFSNYFSFRNIRKFENYIKIEFGVSFSKKGDHIFIEFTDAFSQSRIEVIFN